VHRRVQPKRSADLRIRSVLEGPPAADSEIRSPYGLRITDYTDYGFRISDLTCPLGASLLRAMSQFHNRLLGALLPLCAVASLGWCMAASAEDGVKVTKKDD